MDISEQAEIELAEKKEAKQPEILSKKEISEAKSDIARCWVKLIVNFLEYAAIFQIRNNLLPTAKSLSISNDLDENKFNPNLNYELFQLPETVKKVPFDLNFFKHPIKCTYDNCIKDMFLFAMSGCFFAKKYFNIENGFVIDSIEIALDENMLWQYLACFEEDMVDQCKMLKRRYRCLEEFIITPTVKEVDEEELAGSNPDPVRKTPSHVRKFPNHKLNRKHYLDNVKQLWHTTSEIFADLR